MKRILSIANYLNSQDAFIDVGCDHAFLAILMAKRGCKTILATDIHAKALSVAQKNIQKNHLDEVIKTKQTDGLADINLTLYNTLVLSGMGTSTIIHILSSKENLKEIKKIILQSNNDLPFLREFMNQLGYSLKAETCVFEKGHYYIVMKYLLGNEKLNYFVKNFGSYVNNDAYYHHLLSSEHQIIKKIPWYYFKERGRHISHYLLLKVYLLKENWLIQRR